MLVKLSRLDYNHHASVRGSDERVFSCCQFSGVAPSEAAAESPFLLPRIQSVTRRLTVKLSRLPYQGYQLRNQCRPDQDRITKDTQSQWYIQRTCPMFPSLKLKPVVAWSGNHEKKRLLVNGLYCTCSRMDYGLTVSSGQTGQRWSMGER